MPQGPALHQRSKEMRESLVVGSRSDEDVWERGPCLHQSQLRLAWESIEDKGAPNPAFYMDTRPCDILIAG
jgi:hypothetical protein